MPACFRFAARRSGANGVLSNMDNVRGLVALL